MIDGIQVRILPFVTSRPTRSTKNFFFLSVKYTTIAVLIRLFAMRYEKHQAKMHAENAQMHKIEEQVAATSAVGAGGYVFHEHHEEDRIGYA